MRLSNGTMSFFMPLKARFETLPKHIKLATILLLAAPTIFLVELIIRYDNMLWEARSTPPIVARIPNADLLFLTSATGVLLYMFVSMTIAMFISIKSKTARKVVTILAFIHVAIAISTLPFYVYLWSVEALTCTIYTLIDLSIAISLYTPSSRSWFNDTGMVGLHAE